MAEQVVRRVQTAATIAARGFVGSLACATRVPVAGLARTVPITTRRSAAALALASGEARKTAAATARTAASPSRCCTHRNAVARRSRESVSQSVRLATAHLASRCRSRLSCMKELPTASSSSFDAVTPNCAPTARHEGRCEQLHTNRGVRTRGSCAHLPLQVQHLQRLLHERSGRARPQRTPRVPHTSPTQEGSDGGLGRSAQDCRGPAAAPRALTTEQCTPTWAARR